MDAVEKRTSRNNQAGHRTSGRGHIASLVSLLFCRACHLMCSLDLLAAVTEILLPLTYSEPPAQAVESSETNMLYSCKHAKEVISSLIHSFLESSSIHCNS